MKVYAYKLGIICQFKYKREGIACLPVMARALGYAVWAVAPPGVMRADLPRGCGIEGCMVEAEGEDAALQRLINVECIIARP